MAILNATPDSFFDGGRYTTADAITRQAEKCLAEGAAILDVGGVSTRPGAAEVTEAEELERVIPAIKAIHAAFPEALISVDTFRYEVAAAALDAGASMINDIYAGRYDDRLFGLAAQHACPYILMHMQGTPATMQRQPHYGDVLSELFDFFTERMAAARNAGVKDVVIDPGFGFGKTLEQNYKLLKNLPIFGSLQAPVLAGLSRKRMIAAVLGDGPEAALIGTVAANMLALAGGARILRVHDVKAAADALKIREQYELA